MEFCEYPYMSIQRITSPAKTSCNIPTKDNSAPVVICGPLWPPSTPKSHLRRHPRPGFLNDQVNLTKDM